MKIEIAATALTLLFTGLAFAHPEHDPSMGHLKFAGGKIHAHLHWMTPPPSDDAKIRLEWHNGANHAALAPKGTTTVEIFSGKAVSEATVKPLKDEVGVFEVTQIHMPKLADDSEVRVTLKQDGQAAETEVWKVDKSTVPNHEK